MDAQRAAAGSPGVDRGGNRGRRVHDQRVAGLQVRTEIGEDGVRDVNVAVGDEQAYVAAPDAARFGRLVRFGCGRQRDVERGASSGTIDDRGHQTNSETRVRPLW